jgi:hypothetical protein
VPNTSKNNLLTAGNVFEDVKSSIDNAGTPVKLATQLTGIYDVVVFGAAALAASKGPITSAVARDLLIKGAKVAINFIPFDKLAIKGLELIGTSCGTKVAEKIFTEELEVALANSAIDAVSTAMKGGTVSVDALLKIEKDVITSEVSKVVAKEVDTLLVPIIQILENGSKTKNISATKDLVVKHLLGTSLFNEKEVLVLADQIVASGLVGAVNSVGRATKAEEIIAKNLTESITKYFDELITSGKFGVKYTQLFNSNIAKAIDNNLQLSNEAKEILKSNLLQDALRIKMLREGAHAGIVQGVEESCKKQFDALRKRLKAPSVHFRKPSKSRHESSIDEDATDEINSDKFAKLIDWDAIRTEVAEGKIEPTKPLKQGIDAVNRGNQTGHEGHTAEKIVEKLVEHTKKK